MTLVFVVPLPRTVPPSYAAKSVSCFWYPPCTELMVTQSVRDNSIQSSPRSFVEILQKVLISWNDVYHASIGRLFERVHQSQLSVVLDHLRVKHINAPIPELTCICLMAGGLLVKTWRQSLRKRDVRPSHDVTSECKTKKRFVKWLLHANAHPAARI